MPLLLGYLAAIVLLVGSGIGALHWLVTPEPVQIVSTSREKAAKPIKKPSDVAVAKQRVQETKPDDRRERASVAATELQAPLPATDGQSAGAEQDVRDEKSAADAGLTDAKPAAEKTASEKTASSDAPVAAPAVAEPVAAEPAASETVDTDVTVVKTAGDSSTHQQPAAPEPSSNPVAAPAEAKVAGRAESLSRLKYARSKADTPSHKRRTAVANRQQPYQMMILRTYVRPDGSRFQQLIPMSRAHFAFEQDW